MGVGGSVIGTVLGVLLGWCLSLRTAREEREWQESQTLRQRQERAAEQLRADLIAVQETMPNSLRPPAEAVDDLLAAHRRFRAAWTRASLLTDRTIEDRVGAFDMVLFTAVMDSQGTGPEPINYWILERAAVDLRKALDAFLRREPPPAPNFPSSSEQIEIMGSSPRGLDRIRAHLAEQRVG